MRWISFLCLCATKPKEVFNNSTNSRIKTQKHPNKPFLLMTSSSLAPSLSPRATFLCTRLRWPDVLHAHLTFDSNVEQQQEQHPSSWMFRLLHTGNFMVLSCCCSPHAAFLLLLLLSANSSALSSFSVPSTVPCGCSSSASCHLKWSSVPYKHHFSYSFLPLSIKCFSLRKDHITWLRLFIVCTHAAVTAGCPQDGRASSDSSSTTLLCRQHVLP